MSADVSELAWVPDDATFAARLALVRQRMRWNIKEAALACGIKYATWRDWELNGREPHKMQEACLLIAASTGCNHIWLQTGEDHPTPPVPPAGFEPATFCSEDPMDQPQGDVGDELAERRKPLAEVIPIRRLA